MTSFMCTGWLPRDADVRTPAKGSGRILFFSAVVKDVEGSDELLYFHAVDPALIERCAPQLVRGRAVVITAKLCRAWHPMAPDGKVTGYRATEIEIPDRTKRQDEAHAKSPLAEVAS